LSTSTNVVTYTGQGISFSEFVQVWKHKAKLQLSEEVKAKINASHSFLKDFASNKVIYGINTGFGPMAPYVIEDSKIKALQYNLIRSHAAGTGKCMSNDDVRAALIARMSSLAQGSSGVHMQVVENLLFFINNEIYPVIREHGGVGASGDLVQLGQIALALIGEGKVSWNGKIVIAAEAYQHYGVKPLEVQLREGIALINGTSTMTGIGLSNVYKANHLVQWSVVLSAILNEIAKAYTDYFSESLNNVKPHKGQQEVARMMRSIIASSQLMRNRADHLYTKEGYKPGLIEDKVQEYYSLRCIPQIVGPIYDTVKYAEEVLTNELCSVNDNPVVDKEVGSVFHGGNFHGDYVALEMDKIKIAITKLSMLAERQLNYVFNKRLNGFIPPFLNGGELGFNFGLQAIQFTATSTTAENQTLSNPMYVHSISTNNDNQDIVSMGTNAALITKTVIENTYQVIGIELMALTQAIKLLGLQNQVSKTAQELYNKSIVILPDFSKDQELSDSIDTFVEFVKNNQPTIQS
jgi:histidine ammonia-lyase